LSGERDNLNGSRRFALILFGPPGSGKGTQAKMLTAETGFPHISTGDMLRERIKAEDALGRLIQAILRSGQLVTDDLVIQMVEERISQPDAEEGFMLDGFPRTLPQAETMLGLLAQRGYGHLVVHLKVDYNKLVARLTARRQCPQCGTLYNLLSKPPLVAERCDIEGARLEIREDDSEPVIRKRLFAYEEQTRPLIEFFRQEGSLREIEASDASPGQIADEIRALVGRYKEFGRAA
jgi:adenylate kinase